MHQQALGPRGKILGAHGGTAGRRNDGMLRTTQQNFSAAVMDAAECGPDLGKGRKVGEFAVPLAANDLDEETLMHHHGSTVVAEKQVSSHVQDATGVTAPRRRSFANPANDFAAGGASGTDAAALRAALTGQHVTPDHTVIDANLRASTATVRGVRLSAADGNTPVGVSSTSSSGHTPSSKPDGHVASSGLRRVGSSQRRVGSDSCMGASDDGVTTSAVVAVTKSRGGRRGSGDGQAKIAFEASDTASKKPLVKTSGLRARWLKRKTGSGGDGSSSKRGVKGPTRVKALWSKVARYTTFLSTLRQLKDDAELKKIFGRTITARELDRFALRTKWMVHPERGWRKMWDILLTACLVTSIFMTPYELSFDFQASFSGDDQQAFIWAFFDLFIMLMFVVDIVLNFRTALVQDDEINENPSAVARHYLTGWFTVDVLSTVPWEALVGVFLSASASSNVKWSAAPKVLKSLRLLRLMRMLRMLKLQAMIGTLTAEFSLIVGTVARLLQVVFWMTLVAHLMGCAWYFMAADAGLGSGTWADEWNMEDRTRGSRYIISVYWAFVTVTTVGYGDIVPTTDAERVFVIVCTFIGNGIFAFMVGRVTALASQMNASHQLFVEKMDSVNEFMHYRGLPHNLRKRIRAFYHSFWNRGIYFNENAILGDLTFDLQKDVARFLNQDVIRSVPFFIGMADDCVNTIISRLITRHVLEGDVIVREGDFGAYMFVVRKGVVSVTQDDIVRHYLTRGGFFGEICLVHPAERRTATIIAVTPCELAALHRSDYHDIAAMFPEFSNVLQRVAAAHVRLDEVRPDSMPVDVQFVQTPPANPDANPDAKVKQLRQQADERTKEVRHMERGGNGRTFTDILGSHERATPTPGLDNSSSRRPRASTTSRRSQQSRHTQPRPHLHSHSSSRDDIPFDWDSSLGLRESKYAPEGRAASAAAAAGAAAGAGAGAGAGDTGGDETSGTGGAAAGDQQRVGVSTSPSSSRLVSGGHRPHMSHSVSFDLPTDISVAPTETLGDEDNPDDAPLPPADTIEGLMALEYAQSRRLAFDTAVAASAQATPRPAGPEECGASGKPPLPALQLGGGASEAKPDSGVAGLAPLRPPPLVTGGGGMPSPLRVPMYGMSFRPDGQPVYSLPGMQTLPPLGGPPLATPALSLRGRRASGSTTTSNRIRLHDLGIRRHSTSQASTPSANAKRRRRASTGDFMFDVGRARRMSMMGAEPTPAAMPQRDSAAQQELVALMHAMRSEMTALRVSVGSLHEKVAQLESSRLL